MRRIARDSVLALLTVALAWVFAAHADASRIVLSTPGPGNLAYLPADLIPRIGADRAEGVTLEVRHFSGGPLALRDMLAGNADFAFAGIPAHATVRAGGGKLVSLAELNQTATFVLMVRSDLKGKVRSPRDLKGRTIGINTSSRGGKSTSQLLAEMALRRAGVEPALANYVPAGQNYAEQSAALKSRSVDALMGDEPFASRLKRDGTVYFLMDMHQVAETRRLFGGLFIHAALAAREAMPSEDPDKCRKMVAMLRRALEYLHSHSADQIVQVLEIADPVERAAMRAALARDKEAFSPDGSFTAGGILATERFFHEVTRGDPAADAVRFDSFIVDRWSGRRP